MWTNYTNTTMKGNRRRGFEVQSKTGKAAPPPPLTRYSHPYLTPMKVFEQKFPVIQHCDLPREIGLQTVIIYRVTVWVIADKAISSSSNSRDRFDECETRTGRKLARRVCDDCSQTTQSVFATALGLNCFIVHYGK